MAKQIYYGSSYSGGVGGGYSFRGAEPYLPTAVGSSRYSTDGLTITDVGERASYLYSTQSSGLRVPSTEIPGVGGAGSYSAGKIGAGLTSVSWRGADGLGVSTSVNSGSKRSSEALRVIQARPLSRMDSSRVILDDSRPDSTPPSNPKLVVLQAPVSPRAERTVSKSSVNLLEQCQSPEQTQSCDIIFLHVRCSTTSLIPSLSTISFSGSS